MSFSPRILRRDIGWGPHPPYVFTYFSSLSRSLVSDTGTLDFGTFVRGDATKLWLIPVGNGATNGALKGIQLRDFTTDAVLTTVTASVALGVDIQDANRWYAMDITAAAPGQEVYLRFFDNDTAGWFGVDLHTMFLEK